MAPSLRTLRMLAALLAAVGLLARPARAVVLCPMESLAVAEEASADEHAHHAEHGPSVGDAADASDRPSEEDAADAMEEPGEGTVPAHEVCPDLAHCAVAAPASANELNAGHVRIRAARVATALDRPTSPVASLEPPPPKRR